MTKHMLVLELSCPQCGALLTEGMKVRLDAHVRETHAKGAVLLSAVFGEYTCETDMEIPEGAVVEFSCPHCEASLMVPAACKLCRAPMVSLNLVRGGYVEFCSRRGCKAHAFGGTGNIDEMMSLMNKMFETPYD
jgi:predicted RNA-binding Zn-ribbon protein involved in translation (DUF1610 family)